MYKCNNKQVAAYSEMSAQHDKHQRHIGSLLLRVLFFKFCFIIIIIIFFYFFFYHADNILLSKFQLFPLLVFFLFFFLNFLRPTPDEQQFVAFGLSIEFMAPNASNNSLLLMRPLTFNKLQKENSPRAQPRKFRQKFCAWLRFAQSAELQKQKKKNK